MLEKPFTTLFGLALMMFVGWVMISDTPAQRMDRACRPVVWSGNVTVSIASLAEPSAHEANKEFQSQAGKPPPPPPDRSKKPLGQRVQGAFDGFNYGCQYALWRLFYEQEYLDYMAELERKAEEQHRKEVEARFGSKKGDQGTNAPPQEGALKKEAATN